MKRILVTGGRDYSDREKVYEVLDQYAPCTVIQGGATGADLLADGWARHNKFPSVNVPADWVKHGRSAGVLRNMQMLDDWHPDEVVAFPGGKGTAHMVMYAKQHSYNVKEIDRTEDES